MIYFFFGSIDFGSIDLEKLFWRNGFGTMDVVSKLENFSNQDRGQVDPARRFCLSKTSFSRFNARPKRTVDGYSSKFLWSQNPKESQTTMHVRKSPRR